MKIFNLIPVDGRKSFNNKCKVIQNDNMYQLQSYDTLICEFNKDTNNIKFYDFDVDLLSNTTVRHINAFFDFCGLTTKSKKEIKTNFLNK